MLYDKRWDKVETKDDVLSTASLIAWLEKQPPEKKYDYFNCCGACLIDQYIGKNTTPDEYASIMDRTNWETEVAAPRPHTFGAALERARALQGSR